MIDAARNVTQGDFHIHRERRACREGRGEGQREPKNQQASARD
jgi:hypothetical protein